MGLDVEWRVPLRGGASLSLGGDVSWRSKQFFNAVDQTRATLQQPAYALVNLRAGWRAPDGRVELTAYLRNASDTVYSTLATNTTNGVTRQVYGLLLSAPRAGLRPARPPVFNAPRRAT